MTTFEISIASTASRLDSSFNQFAVYNVDVKWKTKKWRIARRFNQFHDLHQKLKEEFPNERLPKLPPKKLIRSSTNRQLVKERQEVRTSILRYQYSKLNLLNDE